MPRLAAALVFVALAAPALAQDKAPDKLIFAEASAGPEIDAIMVQGGTFPPGTKFQVARIDLNGDGKEEIVARIEHEEMCNRAGCNMMVLTQRGNRWVALYDEIAKTIEPAEGMTGGWRDLVVDGRPFRYQGGTYRAAGRAPAPKK
jgi:hypothetical protein